MTEEFIFEVMDKFNSSNIVDLELIQSDASISLRKKEACTAGNRKETSTSSGKKSGEEETEVFVKTAADKEDDGDKNSSSSSIQQKSEEKSNCQTLKAPIVGTFYRSPSPDSPAYAEKGTVIKKGNPVCIIEAMKMMNTLNADYDFEVLDVLVENGQLVEFDQPLFSIKKL